VVRVASNINPCDTVYAAMLDTKAQHSHRNADVDAGIAIQIIVVHKAGS
jgi:hypothetical protein